MATMKGAVSKSFMKTPKDAFLAYQRDSKEILEVLQGTKDVYEQIQQILSSSSQMNLIKSEVTLLDDEDQQRIETVSQTPQLVVVGQTNSGKSSLINELLGGTVVAMSQVPCTARVVKIKYGESNKVRIRSKDGKILEERAMKSKVIPNDIMELKEEKRRDPEIINSWVEAEINNDFLKSGIEIIDSPGLQESEILNEIVFEAVDNQKSFLMYVVDGRNQFTDQDLLDITRLYHTTTGIRRNMLFVVTKVDGDTKTDGDNRDKVQERKRRVYDRLVDEGFLTNGPMEKCDIFHGISCWRVKSYRRGKCKNRDTFVDDFHHFQKCVYEFVENSLNAEIKNSCNILIASHCRCIDYFIMKATEVKDPEHRENILKECKAIEDDVFQKAMSKLKARKKFLQREIRNVIETETGNIVACIREYTLLDTDVEKNMQTRHTSDAQLYSKKIKQLVTEKVSIALRKRIADSFKEEDDSIIQLSKVVKDLENQKQDSEVAAIIKQCTMGSYRVETAFSICRNPLLSRLKIWLTKSSTCDDIKDDVITADWKEARVLKTLSMIDAKFVAKELISESKAHLQKSKKQFHKAIDQLRNLMKMDTTITNNERMNIRELAPSVADLELRLLSIISMQEFGVPELADEIGHGSQGTVFDCGKMGPYGVTCVTKRVKPNHRETVAMEVHYTRCVHQHQRILPLLATIIEGEEVYLVTPKMKCSLNIALPNYPYLKDRLQFALQISEGLEFLHRRGIVHRDIKAANILLDENDKVKVADLGCCKAEGFINDTVIGTPLAMAPEVGLRTVYDKMVDVYAFGILLWFICNGTDTLPEAYRPYQSTLPPISVRPDRLDKFDKHCWELMDKCWRKDAATRPSFLEITKELKSILNNVDSEAN
ncbi:dual serine/threonine and tyrosine protein kinase-like [Saccoglossus kowalevskii]|uniref:Dual serine/threonine and tyrosine protein kinase n=1 Tax=Saccoglossus kowalevskii TaxID=10224 RepID=A0ABM0GX82_SACKO|nr:PREDICTED: dual serine/threonine and tyrosine protein kinase-like [Saccoglossus kowalevskii]